MGSIRTILAERRIGSACRRHAVNKAEILENLHRPGLDTFAARPAERLCVLLDQAERNPAPGKVDRESQACGPAPHD
ncbi:hypothetical protein AOR01nite_18230 [Acetobacter orleanensis]|uniref:Uncharacterized protein n=1 Tax=Acetobacter orleanensis TaxID=104099 RepID=A0A4Y3TLW1_9PROT|nr:hypothetical protein Abol_002_035 [Acetobacter orleanensis JCM 7639]GEB83346.1 hypothetical protein AOR01nite_18230 [Acetobacter orleanensis]